MQFLHNSAPNIQVLQLQYPKLDCLAVREGGRIIMEPADIVLKETNKSLISNDAANSENPQYNHGFRFA